METKIINDQIEYNIFGEGPTFTYSQGGGHPFWDWDMSGMEEGMSKKIGENSDMTLSLNNGVLRLETVFNPLEYITEEDFDQWWSENNVDGVIECNYFEDMSSMLVKKEDKWMLIDQVDYSKLEEE